MNVTSRIMICCAIAASAAPVQAQPKIVTVPLAAGYSLSLGTENFGGGYRDTFVAVHNASFSNGVGARANRSEDGLFWAIDGGFNEGPVLPGLEASVWGSPQYENPVNVRVCLPGGNCPIDLP